MKIEEREKACMDLLGRLPKRFVLVGGYAVSSFDFPRFSVNLDLVIKGSDLHEFEEILQEQGFLAVQESNEFSEAYSGKFIRFEKKIGGLPVNVDLLVDMIQSRQTNASYSFDYAWKNSEIRAVVGYGPKSTVECRVADREMLIALKINSMKTVDMRDIISLCNRPANLKKVIAHLKRAPKEIILSHAELFLNKVQASEAKDSIKGVFGISDRIYAGVLKNSSDLMRKMIREIQT